MWKKMRGSDKIARLDSIVDQLRDADMVVHREEALLVISLRDSQTGVDLYELLDSVQGAEFTIEMVGRKEFEVTADRVYDHTA